jgi:FKBP12-rapamycin complex-associated protein
MFGAGLDVCMESFFETIDIIPSKQKPRKPRIRGTDGHEYQFIAKAHEGLETDHRAMQFFSLMNEFLQTRIPVYAITPLTSALELIQGLPNTITFHDLLQNCMNNVAPTWSKLSNG